MSNRLRSNYSALNVAIVNDWMTAYGGSDTFLKVLINVFPKCKIFTLKYNDKAYEGEEIIKNSEVYSSKFDNFPLNYLKPPFINLFAPKVVEGLLSNHDYDLVISIGTGLSKGVKVKEGIPHLSIMFSPPKYLWESLEKDYPLMTLSKPILPFIKKLLRNWDLRTFNNPDKVVGISQYISEYIEKVYGEEVGYLYPPLSQSWFDSTKETTVEKRNFFLVVSRLYKYKKIDKVIRVFKELDQQLIIIGDGPDRDSLEKLATGCDNIVFLGFAEKSEVKAHMQQAEALIFPGIEDFGYTPLEAMALGTPTIYYKNGGVPEILANSPTYGQSFKIDTELKQAIKTFKKSEYNHDKLVARAKEFNTEEFIKNLDKQIKDVIKKER